MGTVIPHPIPYQGSKRRLASVILQLAPKKVETLFEPFAGSAAITLAAAARKMANRYVIGDSLEALVGIWKTILEEPENLADEYERIWRAQQEDPPTHYLMVRDEYNRSRNNAAQLLYLLARCVKNAVRFNGAGEFNQSADHRRTGMNPGKMRTQIQVACKLLAGRTTAVATDYSSLWTRRRITTPCTWTRRTRASLAEIHGTFSNWTSINSFPTLTV